MALKFGKSKIIGVDRLHRKNLTTIHKTNIRRLDKVKEILVDQFDLEEDEVTLTTDLTNDIDADSLDLFEVLNRVEDDFDIKLAVAEDIKTTQDLVDKVKEQLAA